MSQKSPARPRTNTKDSEEARRHHRAELEALKKILTADITSVPVQITTSKKETYTGSLINISPSGIKIASPRRLEEGEKLKLAFLLNNRTITTNAITVWVTYAGGGCRAGLEFKQISSELAKFIDDISAGNMPNVI